MKTRSLLAVVLVAAAVTANASTDDAVAPPQAAADQATAVKLAKKQDLPALEKADQAVIEQLWPAKRRVSVTAATALRKLRAALVTGDVPPSAGESQYEISFYRGKQLLREVWVYPEGEWGFHRPKPPHWTTGSNPALAKLVAELVGKR
jgi:hypothetical protein